MKEFWITSALPFAGVTAAIAGLTGVLFEVPREPLLPAPAPRASSSAGGPGPTGALVAAPPDRMDAAIARALRALQPTLPQGAAAPGTQGAPPTTVHPEMRGAASALVAAVKAARDARSDQDLVRAEALLREARHQMEASCSAAEGPLCESAKEIRELGY